jgi:1-acyl-sn-glycerol-3-phosphate acyltransferase
MSSAREVEATKAALIERAVAFLGPRREAQVEGFRARIGALLDEAGPEALAHLIARVRDTGQGWGYHPAEPLARRIHYAMAELTLTDDSELLGLDALAEVRDRALLFVPNHVSYADANVFEILLHRFGFDDVADRLTVLAGPKVYADELRRFSSLCFGTLKIAQSPSRATGEAVMSAREAAAIAKATIVLARQRLDEGDALLLFPEGTRSRGGGMQPLLAAVARYCERPDTMIVPVGITGTAALIPIDAQHLHPARVVIRAGPALLSDALALRCEGKRQRMVDELGKAIARQLPEPYRGVYG